MPFLDSLDIANRTCQRVGVSQINSINEVSANNFEITFAYDKLRRVELRRNLWGFTIKRTVLRPLTATTLLLSPQLWNAATTYLLGTLVKDANGTIWFSTIADNLNNSPSSTSAWEQYFGPLAVDIFNATANSNVAAWVSTTTYTINTQVNYNGTLYNSLVSNNTNNVPATNSPYWQALGNSGSLQYYAGELCYMPVGNPGSYVIYMSLIDGNTDVPTNVTAWNNFTQYTNDSTVNYNGQQWRSLLTVNLNITPAQPPIGYDPNAIYATGNQVTAADGYIYTSLSNGNQGNQPTTSPAFWTNTTVPAAWTAVPMLQPSSTNWLPLFASLSPLPIFWPINSGPVQDTTTLNAYHLPAGYLRKANQDPKAGQSSYLGGPGGAIINDWVIEGRYIITSDSDPIIFRFGADVTDVIKMDDMFCEGLACRIGMEVCERLTQSTSKVIKLEQAYKQVMGDARTVNAIEQGSEESPEDDWITCRQ